MIAARNDLTADDQHSSDRRIRARASDTFLSFGQRYSHEPLVICRASHELEIRLSSCNAIADPQNKLPNACNISADLSYPLSIALRHYGAFEQAELLSYA